MKPPARLWRCEPPSAPPDIADLTQLLRVYLALTNPAPETPLVRALRGPR
jgi:hypothetical protein